MKGFIYGLSNPTTGNVFYIGSTFDVKQRLISHRSAYGLGTTMQILQEVNVVNRCEMIKTEGKWIKDFIAKGIELKNIHLTREPIKFKADYCVRLGRLLEPLKVEAKMKGITVSKLILNILQEYVDSKHQLLAIA